MRVVVIVAIGLLCRSVAALTDADRVQVYHDFRAAFDYSIRVVETAYGKTDRHVLRPLGRSAHWQERMGRYTTARILYSRALQIAEQTGGSGSINTVDPLEGIARTYRLEFVAYASESEADPTVEHSQQLNPDGERAILMALRRSLHRNSSPTGRPCRP